VLGQDNMPWKSRAGTLPTFFHVAAPPTGLPDLNTYPRLSSATHSLAVGQERLVKQLSPPIRWVGVKAIDPPVGLLEVIRTCQE